jgi:hypothetical protein
LSLKQRTQSQRMGSICKPFATHKNCMKHLLNAKLTLLDISTYQFNNHDMRDEIFHLKNK